MNGAFSPIAVGAAVAFCAFATAGQSLADEIPASENVQSAHFLRLSEAESADDSPVDGVPAGHGSRIFPYVDYVTLTQDQAFQDPEWVSTTSENRLLARLGPRSNNSNSDESDQLFAGRSNSFTLTKASDEQSELTGPAAGNVEQPKAGSAKSFVPRPISSIRLDGIQRPVSSNGEPLQVPDTQRAQSERPHSVEEHFTASPWHRAHPPRNTVAFLHQPLYFEDPNLERCGESSGWLTEAVNIAHFAGRIPLTGYMMGANPPCACVRALPDCPTCQRFGTEAYLPRPTVRALATQAAATTGIIFLIP